jgi:small-conductance mechanosensitive channel
MHFDFTAELNTAQSLVHDLIALLPNLVLGVLVFAAFYFVGRNIRAFVHRITEKHQRARNVGLVLGRLAQGTVVFVGLLVSLSVILPSFKPGQVVQLLGISGVAIDFAFQGIFKNYLSGILILLTEPFRIGDQIVVKGFEGTMDDIQTRATTIKTYDGRRVVIPNGDLFTESVVVNTAFEQRRSEYDVGIGYGDDISRARGLVLQAMRDVSGVLSDPPPDALVVDLADSTVVIRARWWSKPHKGEVLQVQDRVLEAIKNTLTTNGIDLPFPTHQVLFHDQTEETDGDRERQREGWPAGKSTPPRPRPIASDVARPAAAINETQRDGRS